MAYKFGLPSNLVWLSHVLIGLFLLFVGFQLLNKKPVHQYAAIALLVLGALGSLYHAHLFYLGNF